MKRRVTAPFSVEFLIEKRQNHAVRTTIVNTYDRGEHRKENHLFFDPPDSWKFTSAAVQHGRFDYCRKLCGKQRSGGSRFQYGPDWPFDCVQPGSFCGGRRGGRPVSGGKEQKGRSGFHSYSLRPGGNSGNYSDSRRNHLQPPASGMDEYAGGGSGGFGYLSSDLFWRPDF